MKTRTPQLFFFLSRFFFTLALLVFVFTKVSLDSIWRVLSVGNHSYILLTGMLLLPFLLLESCKWHLLGKELDSKSSFWDSMKLYLQKTALDIVAPLYSDSKITISKSKIGRRKPGSVSFVNRVSEAWIAFFFVLLGGQRLFTKSSSFLILLSVIVIILLLYQCRERNIAGRLVPFKPLRVVLKASALVSWPFSNILIILSFLTMLVFLLQSYLLLLAFSPVSTSVILFVFPFVFLTSFIPITIGSLGIREITAVYLLSYFSVPAAAAVAVSLLLFSFNIAVPVILGSLLFCFKKR